MIIDAQLLAAELSSADRDEARVALETFSRCIPSVTAPLDRSILRTVLLDVAFKSGTTLHARLHAGRCSHCAYSPAAVLDRFWSERQEAPRAQFDRWLTALFAELNQSHPPSLASSIGRLVKREVSNPWSLEELAKRFHATPSLIRRVFQREFGTSVSAYQRRARVSASMESVRNQKLEVVASTVGFRSPKNFYRAFAQSVGLTPRAYRKLSEEQACDLKTLTKRRLLRLR